LSFTGNIAPQQGALCRAAMQRREAAGFKKYSLSEMLRISGSISESSWVLKSLSFL
jgi:hypothetical protein